MKRVLHFISIAAIAMSVATLGWHYRPSYPDARMGVDAIAVGERKDIVFRTPSEVFDGFSDVDVEDQLRDWILYAVVSNTALDEESFRKAMYDVPPSRAQYVKPVAAFQFGPVRYRVVDEEGATVALVPADDPRRKDYLSQVADSVRSSLGSKPSILKVFEYTLNPAEFAASITRTRNIAGDELFTSAWDYVQARPKSVEELRSFLHGIDDLVYAGPSSDSLELGGRKVPGSTGRKMCVEDVATLWQSEKMLSSDRAKVKAFKSRWESSDPVREIVEPLYQKELEGIMQAYPESTAAGRLSSRIGGLTPEQIELLGESSGGSELLRKHGRAETGRVAPRLRRRYGSLDPSLEEQPAGEVPDLLSGTTSMSERDAAVAKLKAKYADKFVRKLVKPQYDKELAALKASLSSKDGNGLVVDGSGFSLDPAYDYTKLRQGFQTLRPILARLAPDANLDEVDRRLAASEEGPFLELLYKIEHTNESVQPFIRQLTAPFLNAARFQHARYDGALKGTEVGMVLFYTDLMAKLWALDYLESAPGQVRGFVPLLKVNVSSIYNREINELSSTRLWFGPRESAFAKTSTGLYFSRIATRVYAASSNTLQPGKEEEANASSSLFLGWWNDHYSDVADHEPEYYRLNQIMKWSVVLSLLSSNDTLEQLSWLADYPVNRKNWFPVWARQNGQLRFRDWDRVEFYNAGYKGVETESMAILRSRWYGDGAMKRGLSGGVSLSSAERLSKLPELPSSVDALLRRANMSEVAGAAGSRSLQTAEKIVYDFAPIKAGQPPIVLAKGTNKLRGVDAELKPGVFQLAFSKQGPSTRVRVNSNDKQVADLQVRRAVNTNAIDVLFSPGTLEYGRSYSKTLSRAATPEERVRMLANRPDVRRAIQFGDRFYVESKNASGTWLKISPEGSPRTTIAGEADLRFASVGPRADDAPRYNVAVLDRAAVEQELKAGRYLAVEESANAARGEAVVVLNKGPPPPPPPGGHVVDLAGEQPQKGGVLAVLDARKAGGDVGLDFLARKAALDPDGAILLLAETRRTGVAHAKRLIQDGKFEEARLEVENLSLWSPNDPEVRLLRVIAHGASPKSPLAAAEAARIPVSKSDISHLLELADTTRPNLDTQGVARLDTLLRGLIARSAGYDVRFTGTAYQYGVELRFGELRNAVIPGGQVPEQTLRYSLDPNPILAGIASPPASQPITGKLRVPGVAVFGPDTIVDLKTGARYKRSGDSFIDTSFGGSGPSFRDRYHSLLNCPNLWDRDSNTTKRNNQEQRAGCAEDVYLEPAAAAGDDKLARP